MATAAAAAAAAAQVNFTAAGESADDLIVRTLLALRAAHTPASPAAGAPDPAGRDAVEAGGGAAAAAAAAAAALRELEAAAAGGGAPPGGWIVLRRRGGPRGRRPGAEGALRALGLFRPGSAAALPAGSPRECAAAARALARLGGLLGGVVRVGRAARGAGDVAVVTRDVALTHRAWAAGGVVIPTSVWLRGLDA